MGVPTEPSWGLKDRIEEAIAGGSQAAWGARAIWKPFTTPDIVYDRHGFVVPQNVEEGGAELRAKGLSFLLQRRLEQAWEKLRELEERSLISPSECGEHVLFEDHLVTIVADARASYGYLYLAAFLRPEEFDAATWSGDGRVPDFGDRVRVMGLEGRVVGHGIEHGYIGCGIELDEPLKDGRTELFMYGCEITVLSA